MKCGRLLKKVAELNKFLFPEKNWIILQTKLLILLSFEKQDRYLGYVF